MSSYVPNKLRGVLGGRGSISDDDDGSGGKAPRPRGRKTKPWQADAASWKRQLQDRKAVYDHFALPEGQQEEGDGGQHEEDEGGQQLRGPAATATAWSEEGGEGGDDPPDGGGGSVGGPAGTIEAVLGPADERQQPSSPNQRDRAAAMATATMPSIPRRREEPESVAVSPASSPARRPVSPPSDGAPSLTPVSASAGPTIPAWDAPPSPELDVDDYDDDGIMASRSPPFGGDDEDPPSLALLSPDDHSKWQQQQHHQHHQVYLQGEEEDPIDDDDVDDDTADDFSLGTVGSVVLHSAEPSSSSSVASTQAIYGGSKHRQTQAAEKRHSTRGTTLSSSHLAGRHRQDSVCDDDDVGGSKSSSVVSTTTTSVQLPPSLTRTPSFEEVLKEQEDLVQKAISLQRRHDRAAGPASSPSDSITAAVSTTTMIQGWDDRSPSDRSSTHGNEGGHPRQSQHQPSFRPSLSIDTKEPSDEDVEGHDAVHCNYDECDDDGSQRLDTPHPACVRPLDFPSSPSATTEASPGGWTEGPSSASPAGRAEPAQLSPPAAPASPDPLQRARKGLLLADLARSLKGRIVRQEEEEERAALEERGGDDVNNVVLDADVPWGAAAGKATVTPAPPAEGTAESEGAGAETPHDATDQEEESHAATARGGAEDDRGGDKEREFKNTHELEAPTAIREGAEEAADGTDVQSGDDRVGQSDDVETEEPIKPDRLPDFATSTAGGREEEGGPEADLPVTQESIKVIGEPKSPRRVLLTEMTGRLQAVFRGNHHCVEASGRAVMEPPLKLAMRKEPSTEEKESRGFVYEELTAIVSTLPTGHHHVVESPATGGRNNFCADGLGVEDGEGIVLATDYDADETNKKAKKRRESVKAKKWKDRLASKKSTKRDSAGSIVPEDIERETAVPFVEPSTAQDTYRTFDSTWMDHSPVPGLPPRPASRTHDPPQELQGLEGETYGEGNNVTSSSLLSDSATLSEERLLMSPSSHGSKTDVLSPGRSSSGSKTVKWKERLAKRRGSQLPVRSMNELAKNAQEQSETEISGTIVNVPSADCALPVPLQGPSVPGIFDDSTTVFSEVVETTTVVHSYHQTNSDLAVTKESPVGFRDNLRQSFGAFDALLKDRPSLPIDDESVWTEVTEVTTRHACLGAAAAMAERERENINDEEQSYMEITVVESVQPSFVEQAVASASLANPKRFGPSEQVISPFMSTLLSSRMFQDVDPSVITQQKPTLHNHLELNSKNFATIMVQSHGDDDMTQITFDHSLGEDEDYDERECVTQKKSDVLHCESKEEEFFDAVSKSISIPSGHKSEKSVKSKASRKSRKSMKSQQSELSTSSHLSSESSKTRIAEILRKEVWGRDVSVVESALQELDKEAANGSRYRAHIVRCGGVMAIMRTMEMNAEYEAIQIPCCRTLEKLALEPETQAAICEMEGIPLIVRTMQEHADSVAVQEAACATLATICRRQEEDNVKDPMKEAHGAVLTLLTSMTRYADNGRIQAKAFAAISNLCMESRERLAELSEAGGIMTLTMALQRPWENKNEQHEAISQLSILLRGITELNETTVSNENYSTPSENDSSHTTSEDLEELPKATDNKLEGTSRTSEESSSLSTKPDDICKRRGKGRYNAKDMEIDDGDDVAVVSHDSVHRVGDCIGDSANDGEGFALPDKDTKNGRIAGGNTPEHHLASSIGLDVPVSMDDIPEIPNMPSDDEGSVSRAKREKGALDKIDSKSDDKCVIQ